MSLTNRTVGLPPRSRVFLRFRLAAGLVAHPQQMFHYRLSKVLHRLRDRLDRIPDVYPDCPTKLLSLAIAIPVVPLFLQGQVERRPQPLLRGEANRGFSIVGTRCDEPERLCARLLAVALPLRRHERVAARVEAV